MSYGVLTSDVEARWRPLSAAETSVAEELIISAETQINVMRPTLQASVDAGLIPVRIVVDAICESVQRVLRNPDLLRAQNLTGDGGVGITYGLGEDTNHSLPRLRLSPEDLVVIDGALRALPTAPGRVGSAKLVSRW